MNLFCTFTSIKAHAVLPITFDVTLLRRPFRGSEKVIWDGLVVTGASARVGGDYSVAHTGNMGIQRHSSTRFIPSIPIH